MFQPCHSGQSLLHNYRPYQFMYCLTLKTVVTPLLYLWNDQHLFHNHLYSQDIPISCDPSNPSEPSAPIHPLSLISPNPSDPLNSSNPSDMGHQSHTPVSKIMHKHVSDVPSRTWLHN